MKRSRLNNGYYKAEIAVPLKNMNGKRHTSFSFNELCVIIHVVWCCFRYSHFGENLFKCNCSNMLKYDIPQPLGHVFKHNILWSIWNRTVTLSFCTCPKCSCTHSRLMMSIAAHTNLQLDSDFMFAFSVVLILIYI